MSYGYIIFANKPLDFVKKDRRFNFEQMSDHGLYKVYMRFEEGNGLISKNHDIGTISGDGEKFMSRLDVSGEVFFMLFLMTGYIGDVDIDKKMHQIIERQQFGTINFRSDAAMKIDHVYKIISKV
jgi:hypothetical protein